MSSRKLNQSSQKYRDRRDHRRRLPPNRYSTFDFASADFVCVCIAAFACGFALIFIFDLITSLICRAADYGFCCSSFVKNAVDASARCVELCGAAPLGFMQGVQSRTEVGLEVIVTAWPFSTI